MRRNFDRALSGLTVLERDGRLAVGLCGQLLRRLGATVVRCERAEPDFPELSAAAARRAARLVRDGKSCERAADTWQRWLAAADVVLLGPEDDAEPESVVGAASPRVVCAISPFGLRAPEGYAAGEVELQAQAGLMAVTGALGGPPESIGIPVVETMAALNAATSIVAALRGPGTGPHVLDIALFDASLALFSTFVGTVHAGKPSGYRLGAAHHLCAPWNAYATRDGWIQLCSANDEEWRKVLDVVGRSDLRNDPRYASGGARVAHSAEVDGYVTAWTATRDAHAAVAAFEAVGVPVGRIRRVPEVVAARGDGAGAAIGNVGFLKRGSDGAAQAEPDVDARAAIVADRPLAGVRVLEIGPYTAGPLAGRYLADLGAEVIKIEPAGGEVSRRWDPKGGPWSVFFVNCNVGKKFVSLDLRSEADRTAFLQLAATTDVVLTNLKPGALDRLGVGARALRSLFPRLIFCSVSGFGLEGDARPALDTVVQAEAGLMSLVGDGARPVRIGVSIADQGDAHAAPLAILAALAERDASGHGTLIDLSMYDVMIWLTELTWPDGAAAVRPWTRVEARDGYVLVDAEPRTGAELGDETARRSRGDLVAALTRSGARAVAALELDEVFGHAAVKRRGLVNRIGPDDAAVPLLRAPHRLGPEAPAYARICAAPDADRDALIPGST